MTSLLRETSLRRVFLFRDRALEPFALQYARKLIVYRCRLYLA